MANRCSYCVSFSFSFGPLHLFVLVAETTGKRGSTRICLLRKKKKKISLFLFSGSAMRLFVRVVSEPSYYHIKMTPYLPSFIDE